MSAVLADTDRLSGDRLSEVVDIIIEHRTGATLEEIVEAAKRGYVTEKQAVRALEKQYRQDARHKQEREIPCGDLIHDQAAPDVPEEVLLVEEAERVLLRVVNDLPFEQRRAVEMYYWDGRTQSEIAEWFGVDQKTISRWLAAAREDVARNVGKPCLKVASKLGNSEATFLELMRMAWRKHKHSHHLFYPYQLWLHANVGGYWSGNGIYATRYVDKLPQYLADCFKHPPVIPRDV